MSLARLQLGGWRLGELGSQTLTLAVPGFPPLELPVRVGPLPHTCAVEDGRFTTAGGGCRDGRTGLAWSMRSAKPMGWGQAIWDAENPAGNSPPVPDDQGRTDDYDPARTAFPLDSSLSNYCHELREGGLAGWRVPTRDELSALASSAPDTLSHFGFDPAVWVHSGQYPSAPCQLALGQCGTTAEGAYFAVCVRRAP